jgi:hypothetical protein
MITNRFGPKPELMICRVALLLVYFGAIQGFGQGRPCGDKPKIGFEYKIVENTQTAFPPNVRSLRVVVQAKYFDDTHMKLLAQSLRKRFCTDDMISAMIFDDVKVAKHLDEGQFLMGRINAPEVRGFYSLKDRGKHEFIEYSRIRGNPTNEVILKLVP